MAINQITEGMTGQQAANTIYNNDLETFNDIGVRAGGVKVGAIGGQYFDPETFEAGKFVNTGNGTISTVTNQNWRLYTSSIPEGVSVLHISGLLNTSGKAYRFEDAQGALLGWGVFTDTSVALNIPEGAKVLKFTYRRDTDPETAGDGVMLDYNATALDWQPFGGIFVTEINGLPLDGSKSVAPLLPVISVSETVQLLALDNIGATNYKGSGLIKNAYVGTDGELKIYPTQSNALDWITAQIQKPEYEEGEDEIITVSGVNLASGKYWKFINSEGQNIQTSGSVQYTNPVFSISWPEGATAFLFNIIRPGSPIEWINSIMVNKGATALDWQPFSKYVTEINGVKIGGATPTPESEYIIEAWGDSTTEGADLANMTAERWTTLLSEKLGISIANYGKSGARSEEITFLLGGLNVTGTVTAGNITAGVNRAIVYNEFDPFRTTSGFGSVQANLFLPNGNAIKGVLSRSGFTAVADTPTTDVSGLTVTLTSDKLTTSRNNVIMLAQGVNNEPLVASGQQTVQDVIDWYTAATSMLNNTFFVWGMLDRGVGEAPGTLRGDMILEVEAFLKTTYGASFIPLRRYLTTPLALADASEIQTDFIPTPEDLAAQAVATVPPSFRSSAGSVHLNALGHKLQAAYFYKHLLSRLP